MNQRVVLSYARRTKSLHICLILALTALSLGLVAVWRYKLVVESKYTALRLQATVTSKPSASHTIVYDERGRLGPGAPLVAGIVNDIPGSPRAVSREWKQLCRLSDINGDDGFAQIAVKSVEGDSLIVSFELVGISSGNDLISRSFMVHILSPETVFHKLRPVSHVIWSDVFVSVRTPLLIEAPNYVGNGRIEIAYVLGEHKGRVTASVRHDSLTIDEITGPLKALPPPVPGMAPMQRSRPTFRLPPKRPGLSPNQDEDGHQLIGPRRRSI
jgi:hypothetical protein